VIRRLRPAAIILVGAAVAGVPFAARAQPAVSRAPAGCTYDTCALRVEPSFLLAPRLLRGRAGVEIGRLGAFGGGVDSLLAGPEEAAANARLYVRDIRARNTLALLGTAAIIGALASTDWLAEDGNDATAQGLAITGAVLGVLTIPLNVNAGRHLSRAIWFYNAALPH
jgi:hypothetical protein